MLAITTFALLMTFVILKANKIMLDLISQSKRILNGRGGVFNVEIYYSSSNSHFLLLLVLCNLSITTLLFICVAIRDFVDIHFWDVVQFELCIVC